MGDFKENFDNVNKRKNAFLKELADFCYKRQAHYTCIRHRERFSEDYDEILIEKDGILFSHVLLYIENATNELILVKSI